MGYPALAIANYFIERARQEGQEVDPLRAQKLVYIAHGWYLAVFGKPLIQEKVEAWKYGPVIPSLYHQLKAYGNQPIPEPVLDISGFRVEAPRVRDEDQKAQQVLDNVWKNYRPYSGVVLSNLTHQPGTPWHEVWSARSGARIPDDKIKRHFIEIARERGGQQHAGEG